MGYPRKRWNLPFWKLSSIKAVPALGSFDMLHPGPATRNTACWKFWSPIAMLSYFQIFWKHWISHLIIKLIIVSLMERCVPHVLWWNLFPGVWSAASMEQRWGWVCCGSKGWDSSDRWCLELFRGVVHSGHVGVVRIHLEFWHKKLRTNEAVFCCLGTVQGPAPADCLSPQLPC